MAVIRLNLGSGPSRYLGYLNVDFDPANHPDLLHDLTQPLPYADGSVGEMFASHVLEHFPLWQIVSVLQHFRRALAPYPAVLWGMVPDGPEVARQYLAACDAGDEWAKRVYIANFCGGFTNNPDIGAGQIHYVVYDEELLRFVLGQAGFNFVQVAHQNPGKYDYRLAFAACHGLIPTPADIRGVGFYPMLPNHLPPWEEEEEGEEG